MPPSQQVPQHFVDSADGARIAVYEEGNPEGPTVVLVHGFPDSHVLWDGVVPLLAERFRLIRYDNRGVGMSSVPKPVSAYTMDRFADDFAAVTGELSPGRPVHVLAHDWGSVGIWHYLKRPGANDRVATFTSVSGPAQDQLVDYIFSGLRAPWKLRTFARAISQALRLTYMIFLSIPVLAPLVLRLTLSIPALRRNAVDNLPIEQIHHSEKLARDAAQSVKTYPANYFRSFSGRKQGVAVIDVPVQLLVNTKDKYVRPYGYDHTSRFVPRLWRRDIRAGHFSPMSHPQVMAAAVREFADQAEGKQPSRALLRAQVGRPRGSFGDTLVSVTGAGSGIGRATAFAFAREGAEVVISDIDEAAVKATAAEIATRGGVAHAYVLDVSDAQAVEAFAERVSAEHGVPDIVDQQRRHRARGRISGHAGRTVRPGARRQPGRRGQRVPVFRAAAGGARHRRLHRQRVVDGRVRPVAVAERVLHVEGRDLHVLRLPARRTRRRRSRTDHDLPRPHRYEHHQHHQIRRASGKAGRRRRWSARATGQDVRAAALRPRQGGQRDPVFGQKEEADSPGGAGSLCAVRPFTPGATGAPERRADARDLRRAKPPVPRRDVPSTASRRSR